ncbi:uncharacterized protein LOC117174384 [Belonocnema kinseyi]|uniref:uncharacterized protein LOC117174384 n=1 Tax=Belonocnema kinseyi TaxID=2817044 RepID=UPI00143DE1FD|nr:uncharacterized protein LOC117174384 [Belonocnema kinseyi]
MKIVYILFFTLVALFNSIELSSQMGQGGSSSHASSSGGTGSHPEEHIPATLEKPLEWKKFTFPKESNLLYYAVTPVQTPTGIGRLHGFKPVPSDFEHEVHVNDRHEAFGFKDKKTGSLYRLYSKPYELAAIKIRGKKPVRPLKEDEIEFLRKNPSGKKPVVADADKNPMVWY